MTATNSGLHFLSGIALYLGAMPQPKVAKPAARKIKSFRKQAEYRHTPLNKREKLELLDAVRHDDWFE